MGAAVVSWAGIVAMVPIAIEDCRAAPLAAFLFGKGNLYTASSFFHTSDFSARSMKNEKVTGVIDCAAVSLSVMSTGIPFSSGNTAAFTAVNLFFVVGVVWTAVRNRMFAKSALLFFQAVFVVCFVGRVTTWHPQWRLAASLAFSAGCSFVPVMQRQRNPPSEPLPVMPWNVQGVWGAWEDFHVLVVATDVAFFSLAAVYVTALECQS